MHGLSLMDRQWLYHPKPKQYCPYAENQRTIKGKHDKHYDISKHLLHGESMGQKQQQC
jgi:hypothetical protein